MSSFRQLLPWIEQNFIEIHASDEVVLDHRYAGTNNFMNLDLYDGFSRCFLHPEAARMLREACLRLRSELPDLQFRIWDALRPRRVQALMFDHLKGGPYETYVAAPHPGSFHNYGLALDLTLQNKNGDLLAMGTDFDDFRDLAQPAHESRFLQDGTLRPHEFANRILLRRLLEGVGFKVLTHEWWHFNALWESPVHGKHPVLE